MDSAIELSVSLEARFFIEAASGNHQEQYVLFDYFLAECCVVLSDPSNPKFQRIKVSSPKIQSDILAVDGALDVLFAIGFQVVAIDSEGVTDDFLVLDQLEDLTVLEFALNALIRFRVDKEKELGK